MRQSTWLGLACLAALAMLALGGCADLALDLFPMPPTKTPIVGVPVFGPTTPTPTQGPPVMVVANTGGQGVWLRRSPTAGDRVKAWPEGTRMTVVGQDKQAEGLIWKNVKDPAGNVGWVPAQYLVLLATPTVVAAVPTPVPGTSTPSPAPTAPPPATSTATAPTNTPTPAAPTATPTPLGPPTPTPRPYVVDKAGCIVPEQAFVRSIVSGLTLSDAALNGVRTKRTNVFGSDAWFLVGAAVTAPSIKGDELALWVTTLDPALNPAGSDIFAANATAQKYSQFAWPNNLKNRFPANDPDVQFVAKCVDAALGR